MGWKHQLVNWFWVGFLFYKQCPCSHSSGQAPSTQNQLLDTMSILGPFNPIPITLWFNSCSDAFMKRNHCMPMCYNMTAFDWSFVIVVLNFFLIFNNYTQSWITKKCDCQFYYKSIFQCQLLFQAEGVVTFYL